MRTMQDVSVDAFQARIVAPTAVAPLEHGPAALHRYVRAFFGSPVFRTETLLLAAVGVGDFKQQHAAPLDLHVPLAMQLGCTLGAGNFKLVATTDKEVLLRWESSFKGLTWLRVQQPEPFTYVLQFGSAIWAYGWRPQPQSLLVRAHRLYSRILLYAAAKRFEAAVASREP
jgi:hypothetical protein